MYLCVCLQVSLREGATQPPPRLFERDLIAAMERHGIGTDATVAGEAVHTGILLCTISTITVTNQGVCAQHWQPWLLLHTVLPQLALNARFTCVLHLY